MTDSLRLELAGQRVRIGALEHRVAHQGDTIKRLKDLVERLVVPTLERAGQTEAKHGHIRALATFLPVGNIEATARRIERLFPRESAVPKGAEFHVEALRRAYNAGGPSRQTIRRALSKFSSADENAMRAAD